MRKLDLIAEELDTLLQHVTLIATSKRDVSKFKGPVSARQRIPVSLHQRLSDLLDREERQAANQAPSLSIAAPERAMADAKNITPNMLGLLKDDDLNNLENRKFVRAFIAELPATERGALSSKTGGLSGEGLTRVGNALLAKAYGDPDIIACVTELTDDDVELISNALVAAAPAWAALRADIEAGSVPPEFDLTPELVEAVKRTADMRGKGATPDEYLAQHDAFDQIEPDVDGFIRCFYDENTKRTLSSQKIGDFLRRYAAEAAKESTEAASGPGMPKLTPHDVLVALKQPRIRPKGADERSQGENKKRRKGANQ